MALRTVFVYAVLCASCALAWVHPGILHTSSDLERIKGYISAGAAGTSSRQYSDYLLFEADSFSSETYGMHTPVAEMNSRTELEHDATAAYHNALMWNFTGDQNHADKAIEIMDAWSGTVKSVNSSYLDKQLASSLGPFLMTNAAEIVRYTSAGWTSAGISAFKTMLLDVFFPVLNDTSGNQYQANIGAGNTKAMLAFGVFTEDSAVYNQGLNYYVNAPCAGLSVDIATTGQSSESGRDQGHAQLGLGNLAEASRISANQGTTDLWGLLSNRLLAGFEYTAQYNLGNSVNYNSSFERCDADALGGPWTEISATSRGDFRSIYENAYAEYVTERGLDAPYTAQVVNNVTTEEGNPTNSPADGAGWGTLLFRTD